MPSYVCTTVTDRLTGEQRAAVARAITAAHHEVTGAPAYFARVQFVEAGPGTVFVGGTPLDHDHVFVVGHIRAGRDADTRATLIERLAADVRGATGVDRLGVWVYLLELEPAHMIEFGHVLPPSGGEQQWQAALPDDDREWLRSLGR